MGTAGGRIHGGSGAGMHGNRRAGPPGELGGGKVRSVDYAPAAERVALTERQMVQLGSGGHSSCQPLDLSVGAADLLDQVFPFNFPIWELDRS